jgi:diazepam-binding inhibitor (GABA receptor modulating acyl-CoA-binding protein)
MSAPQSDAFKKAVTDSKKLTSKPSNDDLLQLYGKLLTLRQTHASFLD